MTGYSVVPLTQSSQRDKNGGFRQADRPGFRDHVKAWLRNVDHRQDPAPDRGARERSRWRQGAWAAVDHPRAAPNQPQHLTRRQEPTPERGARRRGGDATEGTNG